MLRCFCRQPVDSRDKLERRMRWPQAMPFHKIFGEQQIPDRRDDCYQQNTDGAFAVIQQASHERQREFKIARCERGAQLENDACAREWHQLANKFDTYYPILAKESVELFEFVIDQI